MSFGRQPPPSTKSQPQVFNTTGFHGYAPVYGEPVSVRIGRELWDRWERKALDIEYIPDRNIDCYLDGLYDCAWSELNEFQIAVSSGDGSVKLFDVGLQNFPILNLHEHTREVFSVNWNLVRKDTFISGSWDHTIKLWSPSANKSLATWKEHTHCVYQAVWSPHLAERFASASGDGQVKVWDVRSPRSTMSILAHQSEVLALDWNKYDPNVLVSAGVDHSVRVWDIRNPQKEIMNLRGHEYAIRRIKCSPHSKTLVASAGYDMTMRVWETSRGLDFNMFIPGQVATCSWDGTVHLFRL